MLPTLRLPFLVYSIAIPVAVAPVTSLTGARSAVESTAPEVPVAAPPTPIVAPVASAAERVTLDQAIEHALRRNPSAQAAALEFERAETLVRQARAGSLPALTGSASYTHLDHDRVLSGRVTSPKDQFNANVTLSVPLIAPQKWAQWSHAKDDAKVLGLSGDEVRRQLTISVARTFLTVVSQHRVVEVNERALESAKAHEHYAAERLAGGVGRRIDAVRASQQVSTNQASVETSRVALARSMEALGVLLGEERAIDAVEPELDGLSDPARAVASSVNRLDLQVARTRRGAADVKFRDSWIDLLPQLTGQVQPFYQTPATATIPSAGWQAMLMLAVPLYEGGARYGSRDERRILRDQADLALMNLLRQARSEVRIAFEAHRGAEAALTSARSAAKLAHEAEQMAAMAYEAGASTNLEVIDAERQARDADTAVAVAEDALRQARLDLLIASGRFPPEKSGRERYGL
jgi:outer membrane protein